MQDFKVFIGWDSREDVAYQVARHSILKHNPNIEVIPLRQYELREQGVYWRAEDKKGSTEFTLTRFLVPFLSQYRGYSLFMDCDVLAYDDISKIIEEADRGRNVNVVKHDYSPTSKMKMDGKMQHNYPRKNWSSVMLFNNHQCRMLTPELVNNETPMYLHRLLWADEDIGNLDVKWNLLNGYYDDKAVIRHYTDGGPWFEDYRDCPHAAAWREELQELYGIKSFPEDTDV